jgi:hypothetical protein
MPLAMRRTLRYRWAALVTVYIGVCFVAGSSARCIDWWTECLPS